MKNATFRVLAVLFALIAFTAVKTWAQYSFLSASGFALEAPTSITAAGSPVVSSTFSNVNNLKYAELIVNAADTGTSAFTVTLETSSSTSTYLPVSSTYAQAGVSGTSIQVTGTGASFTEIPINLDGLSQYNIASIVSTGTTVVSVELLYNAQNH